MVLFFLLALYFIGKANSSEKSNLPLYSSDVIWKNPDSMRPGSFQIFS
ncbi:hypothetical protein SBDP1_1020003 [Syntrophobacter sp. SbD1]|nr:hypothetical protein SBDP1_1020003 [Syntrophobacter sp. SbD1]